jgi:hypothetical protein
MTTEELLAERQKTHGSFAENARFSQAFKAIVEQAERERPEKAPFTPTMREALDMISTKFARILTGNAHEPDHWQDIAGYSMLVVQSLDEVAIAKSYTAKTEAE